MSNRQSIVHGIVHDKFMKYKRRKTMVYNTQCAYFIKIQIYTQGKRKKVTPKLSHKNLIEQTEK